MNEKSSRLIGVAGSPGISIQPARWRVPLPSLGLHLSERKLLLAMVDLLIVNLSLLAAVSIRTDIEVVNWDAVTVSLWDRAGWFFLFSALWLLVGSFLDIYDLPRAANVWHSLSATSGAAILTIAIYSFIPAVTPPLPIRRIEALLLPTMAILGVGAWRACYARIFVQPNFQRRALVIGTGWVGRTLVQALAEPQEVAGNHHNGSGYRIIGFIDEHGTVEGEPVAGIPVLGTSRDLAELARREHPDELIIAITNSQMIQNELFQAIMACREMGIQITGSVALYERVKGRVPIEHNENSLSTVLPLTQSGTFRFYLLFKRMIDIIVAAIGCLLVVLIAPFVWLTNLLSAPGPLFYWQKRVGQGGRHFSLVKFRSMIVDAEKESGAVFAAHNDARVTPVGRFLRRTRLDELPQSWNILKGEMSVVGPRPERPEFVANLLEEIPCYQARNAAKPGLTGWAQVNYQYGACLQDSLAKLQFDLYYIKYQGILLDLQIIFKTVGVVLRFLGR